MHRTSETIGAIATALAKAQAELANPEKTLTATIPDRNGERSFRYASLASGLELARKALSQHEIAVMQTTAVEEGQIMLTTLLVHASGEWVSSLWPVCPVAEPSAQVKGAALTYARRYALFSLVGIAGEDDLDAPELAHQADEAAPKPPQPRPSKGSVHAPRRPPLGQTDSARSRDQLLQEISTTDGNDALARWAYRSLPLKNTLTAADAKAIETAYLTKVAGPSNNQPAAGESAASSEVPLVPIEPEGIEGSQQDAAEPAMAANEDVPPLTKPLRKRSKAHLAFVASQPCLICQAGPCDAHHLKIARPRS
ncbi:MAG: ERF family protein, partial [Bradyrhizobium sp.]